MKPRPSRCGWCLVLAASALFLLPGRAMAETTQGEPDWLKHVNAQLEKNISFEFVGQPLGDVVAFISQLTGAPIVLDPKAATGEEPITLKVNDIKLWRALRWIVKLVKLEYSIEHGAIFISTKKRIIEGGAKALKPVPKEVKAALAKTVSFDFVDTPLDDVVAFLAKLTEMNILIHPDVQQKKVKITLKVNDMTISDVLGWLMRMHDLTYKAETENVIYIFTREQKEKLEKR